MQFIYNTHAHQFLGIYTEEQILILLQDSLANGVMSGNIELVKWLINRGCIPGIPEWTMAAKNGHLSVLKLLLGFVEELDGDDGGECIDGAIEGGH